MATTAYTIIVPTPAELPKSLVVRTVVMRDDGAELSREELEALAEAFPPPAGARTAVKAAIAAAPTRPARKAAPKSATAKKAPKAAPKPRKAAKRPA